MILRLQGRVSQSKRSEMRTKSFKSYLEKRLSKEEILEIKEQAELEVRFFESIQRMLSETLNKYMEKHQIGFNEIARKLDWSPSKVSNIQKGTANLTLASLAHFFALLGKEPQDIFKKIK